METRTVRFHNIFGPLGTWRGGREKAPAAMCRKVAVAKLSGEPTIEIWGDGEQTRSFCYIDDCVEGIYRLMQSDRKADGLWVLHACGTACRESPATYTGIRWSIRFLSVRPASPRRRTLNRSVS